MIEIDKNIPIAKRTRQSKYPWGEMKIGDSFLVERAASSSSISGAAHSYGLAYNKKFTTRKVRGGVRVWRIE